MNIMTLDAEYNQPSQKTIQIGAAIYDVYSGQIIAEFETYVNPGEPIEPFITELTGITDKDVAHAPSIKEAYEMLEYFHAKHRAFCNPLVWGSGVFNDSQAIHKESGVERDNFMGYRVIDVKSVYQSAQMYKGKQVRGSLETVCKKFLKIGFEGTAHRALTDAKNTFRVWHFLVKRFGEIV